MSDAPTIAVHLQIKTPTMPNFVELEGARPATLDDAYRVKGLVLDVGRLDDEAVEGLIQQWATAFRAHVATRRQRPA